MNERERIEPSSDHVRRRMASQARKDTAPELSLRRALWSRGLRYRVDHRVVGKRRKVDIAFTRAKVAVFVDGCFWHRCPVHGYLPKANAKWWREKLERNVERDRDTDRQLEDAGWLVMRVWEHEDPVRAAEGIESIVRGADPARAERAR